MPKMQKNNSKSAPRRWSWGTFFLTIPYVIWMAVFILIPLGVVMFYALTDPATGLFSLNNLSKIFTGAFPRIFLRSVWYSLVASLICLVIGYPVAYFIARQRPGVQRFLYLLVMLPMCMSFLLRTLAWVGLLRDTGIINQFLGLFGIGPLPLIRTTGAVILGMVYNYLPYMILPLYTVIMKIDPLLIEAAEDLGCICPGHPPPVHARHHLRNHHGVRPCGVHLLHLPEVGLHRHHHDRRCD